VRAEHPDELVVRAEHPREDREIADDLLAAFRRSASLFDNELKVRVSEGHVTLMGRVDSDVKRWTAEELAHQTLGVVEVDNRIEVGAVPIVPRGSPE
jgi:osmotically-inducible protein OsmY